MLLRIVLSFIVGSGIARYGQANGWSFGELIILCIPVGILISLLLNYLEGNFNAPKA